MLNDNVYAFTRTLKGHETYVVLFNIGAREETVDITELTNDFVEKSQVVVAGVDTNYTSG